MTLSQSLPVIFCHNIKHPVYYTALVIVKIKIFVILKKDLDSINFFLNVDNIFTQWYND